MSVLTNYTLLCNGDWCEEQFEDTISIENLRAKAANIGWTHIPTFQDFCPKCSKKRAREKKK